VAALDFTAAEPLGPFRNSEGTTLPPLAEGEIALNRWAADDLQAKVGDTVRLVYFEPESTHGEVNEKTAAFRLAAIVEMSGAAADRDLVPPLRGVTDQLTMVGWNPPFPFDSGRVRPDKDEADWDDYGTTPKAFVSLAEGRRLWGSRFGNMTSLRFSPKLADGELTPASLAEAIDIAPAALGFTFLPIRRDAIRASTGTTPFEGLFLGFSTFLIAAAAMLVALLFRLGSEQRAAESGILLAVGFPPRRAGRVRLVEGLVVSAAGALVGTLVGVAYAALMVWGLTTWWLDAISAPFLELHARPATLVIGWTSGALVAVVTILWAQLRLGRFDVCRLLAGVTTGDATSVRRSGHVSRGVAGGALLGAVASVVASLSLEGEMQALAFFGSGAMVLIGALATVHIWLGREATGGMIIAGRWPRARLAVRNAARHPGRSVLAIALTATACFLIVAISAFHLDPLAESGRAGGSGGFSLMARSDAAIYHDLGDPTARLDLGFSSATARLLDQCKVYSLRVRAGDDASCLNLYQTREPRVLGVPDAFISRGGFGWASFDGERLADPAASPWTLLKQDIEPIEGVAQIPVVVDAATAIYGLHLSGVCDGLDMTDGHGQRVRFVVVGLLKNSLFQGDLLIGDAAFRRHFPQVNGFRSFLIDAPADKADNVATALERDLGDWGLDVEPSTERLAGLLAVQNTYLSTFQSLGGLGLLLGTFGLAVIQLRNVLERRGELALLRATGYPRYRLAELVVLENGVLLVGGMLIGTVAATATLVPHWLAGGAHVPWAWLILTLAAVVIVGLLASIWAVRAVLAAPLVPTLRGE
jgi:ABC-type antimicrobial peptide transport system permease subunit